MLATVLDPAAVNVRAESVANITPAAVLYWLPAGTVVALVAVNVSTAVLAASLGLVIPTKLSR